jgi:peptide/nickel transport system ATP-binding protein
LTRSSGTRLAEEIDMRDNTELLNIKGLTIHYQTANGTVRAVEDLDLRLGCGETLGFVGETGAGKTTTALGVMGIIPQPPGKVVSGEIIYDGEDLLKKSAKEMREVRGKKIAMIFQDPMTSLDPVITVGEQIAEMVRLHDNLSKAEALRKADVMLETVGIPRERSSDYPHQFSGGMKQRVVIAIALACDPSIVIADEPTTALDVTIQAQVLELMRKLKEKNKMSMILITHDLGIVADICDKVAIMYAGNIVESADTVSLFTKPLHPYTMGLFDSIPDLDVEQKELKVIKGMVPDPTNLPRGCPFHPRCPRAMAACASLKPESTEVERGHNVRCHLYGRNGSV